MIKAEFIGACCIIGEVGPSAPPTAPTAFVWVIKWKMPVIILITKSPQIADPLNPST